MSPKNWIRTLFAPRPRTVRTGPRPGARRTRLGLEGLSDRIVPATLLMPDGELLITGSAATDSVTVSRTNGVLQLLSFSPGYGFYREPAAGAVKRITFNGGDGDDRIDNLTDLPLTANGGTGNDTLIGGSGPDILTGGWGNDTLTGRGGDDRYTFNLDSPQELDTIQEYAGGGFDTLDYSAGVVNGVSIDLRVTTGQWVGPYADVILEGNDIEAVDGTQVADFVQGNDLANRLRGNGGNDTLRGGNGNDTLRGNDGHDELYGGEGDDRLGAEYEKVVNTYQVGGGTVTDANDNWHSRLLVAEDGNDWLDGEAGNDLMHGGAGTNSLRGRDGDDYLSGGDGDDSMDGGEGDDTLFGYGGRDWMRGRGGNDVLMGGPGDDHLVGDEGNDNLNGDAVWLFDLHPELAGAMAQGDEYGWGNHYQVGNWAGNDILNGGDGDDHLGTNLSGFDDDAGDDQIDAGNGNDVVWAGSGNDYVLGGSGNDVISGADGHDTLYAQDGSDQMTGGNGNDIMAGGAGDDFMAGGNGNDYLAGDDGNDTMGAVNVLTGTSHPLDFYIITWEGDASLRRSEYYYTAVGEDGDDRLDGGNGDDRIQGGNGNDVLQGEAGNDTLGATWLVTARDAAGSVRHKSDVGEDGNDVLDGGIGHDTLRGGDGSDHLKGLAGDDRLHAGWVRGSGDGDTDRMEGGEGKDLFYQKESRDGTDWYFWGGETISALPG